MLCKCEHVNDVSTFGGTEGVLAVQVQHVPAQNPSQCRLVNYVNKSRGRPTLSGDRSCAIGVVLKAKHNHTPFIQHSTI